MTSENDLISRFADSIMANLPVGVLTVNTELIIGSVNPFAERLFGTEMGVGIGDDLATLAAELFSTEDRNKLLLGIKGTMEGRVIEPFELCFSRSEFGRSVSILLSPLVESGNPVMGAEITMEDITERKNAENALRASEKKYRSIVEQSEDGIIMMDNEGIVIEWNRGQELLTGISGDEALGLPIWDIDFRLCPDHEKNNPNSYDKIKGRALESLKGEDGPLPNRSLEREFHREDGRSIFVQMQLFSIRTERGRMTGCISRDVTDRVKAEMELRKQLMRYELNKGILYLVRESTPNLAVDAFRDIIKVGYEGFLISRRPGGRYKKLSKGSVRKFWLSERNMDNSILPDLNEITAFVEGCRTGTALLFDRLDYLISKNHYENILVFIQDLNELAYTKGLIIILSLDPSSLTPKQLRLIEKECREVEPRRATNLTEGILKVLRFVYKENLIGVNPTYNDIGLVLGISKPTVRKRVRALVHTGYLDQLLSGTKKMVLVTEKGKRLFSQ